MKDILRTSPEYFYTLAASVGSRIKLSSLPSHPLLPYISLAVLSPAPLPPTFLPPLISPLPSHSPSGLSHTSASNLWIHQNREKKVTYLLLSIILSFFLVYLLHTTLMDTSSLLPSLRGCHQLSQSGVATVLP